MPRARDKPIRSHTIPARGIPPQELVDFLQDPASYPHSPADLHLIQTHISYVALVPPWVYKVKKPLNLGFLDFSTLARQKFYCEEEVRLNQRLCPKTYEGVVPIARKNGRLAFGYEGVPVAYAVKMRQLEDGFFLHQGVADGTVTTDHIDRVASHLAAFYRRQRPSAEVAAWGWEEKLRMSTDENFAQTAPFVETLISRPAFEALRYFTDQFFVSQTRLLNQRRAGGHILDCHGDLHLAHIHLKDDALSIFDCIEFNERFRYIDVASDVAFLTMDLTFNGRRDLADRFVQRMAQMLDDPDLLRLVNFYACYRAYVRAKVESLRSHASEVPPKERQQSWERAIRYYQLALHYAVAGSKPCVLVVMGPIGTGKSTLARALGRALGWEVRSSDRVRKERAGLGMYERGEANLYSEARTQDTYATLFEEARQHIQKGQALILDATFSRRTQREALRAYLQDTSLAPVFLELKASEAMVKRRLQQRAGSLQVSDARLEDYETLMRRYEAPDALEDARHLVLENSESLDTITLQALQYLIRLAL